MPDRLGTLILAEGAVLGIVLAAMGIVRVVREVLALKARVEAYADLPLRADIELCERRIAIGERAVDSIGRLQTRSTVAVAELRTDAKRVKMMAELTVAMVRKEIRI